MELSIIMCITNFLIFIGIFLGFEVYIKMRSQKEDVYFIATEVKGFKIFMVLLAASVMVLDILDKQPSFFVYAALFFSYALTYKEIGPTGVVNNLRHYKIKQITKVSLEEKKGVYSFRYGNDTKQFEMLIRQSQANGLEKAVAKLSQNIKA